MRSSKNQQRDLPLELKPSNSLPVLTTVQKHMKEVKLEKFIQQAQRIVVEKENQRKLTHLIQ